MHDPETDGNPNCRKRIQDLEAEEEFIGKLFSHIEIREAARGAVAAFDTAPPWAKTNLLAIAVGRLRTCLEREAAA